MIAKAENSTDFELLYYAIREKEKRVYTDDEVALLPEIALQHTHYREWQIRKRSAGKLVNYLLKKQRKLNILEVGCGNGWLAAQIAKIPDAEVTGLDINETEISQARRVFKKQNLSFVYETLNENTFVTIKFDVIVFAACLPYFKSVESTLQLALSLLNPGGEIHIIDTHFYQPDEVANAAHRCHEYYRQMGFPEMSSQYFHHTMDALCGFRHKVLTNPRSLLNRFVKKEPFYWIAINN